MQRNYVATRQVSYETLRKESLTTWDGFGLENPKVRNPENKKTPNQENLKFSKP